MDRLEEINKNAIFKKIDNIINKDGSVKCNDLIDAISQSKESDKRLINGWSNDLINCKILKCNNVMRKCRVFTPIGIIKYIHIGKIYSYKNVCLYFKTEPIDEKINEINKCMKTKKIFYTKKIMKWLFEKRKQNKILGEEVFINEFLIWIKNYDDEDINKEKQKYLLEFKFENI